jgi:hypothetical protein
MEKSWGGSPASESNGAPFGSTTVSQPLYNLRNEDISRAEKAIEEGRRIYVGNLPYEALTRDVEKLFANDQYIMLVIFSQKILRCLD